MDTQVSKGKDSKDKPSKGEDTATLPPPTLQELYEYALQIGYTNLKYYTNPRKNATLTKFKEVFCDRSTLGLPKNVVPFDSKKSPRTANSKAF